MFEISGHPGPVVEVAPGVAMSGFFAFMDGYRDEAACLAALAQWRWPAGFMSYKQTAVNVPAPP